MDLPLDESIQFMQTELTSIKGCCEILLGKGDNGMFHIQLANKDFEKMLSSEDCETRLSVGLRYLLALKMQIEVLGGCELYEKQSEISRQGKLVCERISDLTSRDVIAVFNNIFDACSAPKVSDGKKKRKSIFSRLFF